MPTMTASTSTLTPEETTLPRTRSARKAVLPKRPKGMRTKPASVVSLNSISVTKSWMARMKKLRRTISPGEHQHDDLDEVFEEGDIAEEREIDSRIGRPASIPTCAMRPGRRKSADDEAASGGFEAKAGKALEDDPGEIVPVADEIGEDADEEGLLDEAGDDVLVGPQLQKSAASVDVDDDQGRRQESDFAAKEAEAGVDIAGEDLEKAIDDAGSAHGVTRSWAGADFGLPAFRARAGLRETCRRGARRRRPSSSAPETFAAAPPRAPGIWDRRPVQWEASRSAAVSLSIGEAFEGAPVGKALTTIAILPRHRRRRRPQRQSSATAPMTMPSGDKSEIFGAEPLFDLHLGAPHQWNMATLPG